MLQAQLSLSAAIIRSNVALLYFNVGFNYDVIYYIG